MAKRGRAARFAYDPAVVLDYIESHTTYGVHGKHNRVCRLINGIRVDEIESRTLRRWLTRTEGVTRRGLVTLLRRQQLSATDFEQWALDQGRNPFLRNKENHA